MKKELKAISPEDYCAAIRQMLVRWMKCVAANGSYFEGRHFAVDLADYGLEVFFETAPEDSASEQDSDT